MDEATYVLVVDDHRPWSEALAEWLRAAGYRVGLEHDGLSAVERLRRELPDILITDYFLPTLDGGKLCQIAKKLANDRPPRTIILTAGCDRTRGRVRAPHADAVIAKNKLEVVAEDLRKVLADPGAMPLDAEEREVLGHERLAPATLLSKVHGFKQYVDALHECMGDAVIGLDAERRVYFLNRMACELLEIGEAEALSRPIDDVLGAPAPDLEVRLDSTVRGDVERHRPFDLEFRGRSLRITVAGLDAGEGGRRVVIVARDLTDLRAEEQARLAAQSRLYRTEKLASLGQMVAGVSHEINNPLTALGPNLQLLERHCATLVEAIRDADPAACDHAAAQDEVPELIGDCLHACERIRAVVADMRLLSHPGEQRGTAVAIDEVLLAALSFAGSDIRARARIEHDLQHTSEIVVDRNALTQAFVNILLNASEAIPPGAPERHVVRAVTRRHGDGVLAEISNSGPPIPSEIQGRVFDPFFTTKLHSGGAGLGLSIAHETVRRHGGYIELFSKPEFPVSFRVWIPDNTGLVLERDRLAHAHAGATARVLVIDDEHMVRNSFRRALEGGHDVTLAGDGREALELIADQEREFDLIICDLIMPKLSGMELYDEVVRRWPDKADRFVFLTGETSSTAARAFLQKVELPRAYKPIDMLELRSLVARCLPAGVSNPPVA